MGQPLHSEAKGLGERGVLARSSTVAATWALFFGFGMVMVGNGLQGSLLGIRSEAEGFGLAVSGIVMAGYFAGFFAGSIYAASALKTVGHIRVFSALASAASTTVLIHAVWINPATWFAMRFLFGICMAGIYVVVESWLNELASNETRGRLLSVYMVVSMGGIVIGQLLLNVADTNGFTLFILASVLVSLALVPVSLSATTGPRIAYPQPTSLMEVWRIVPTGIVTSFFVGASAGTVMGIGAVYAANIGMEAGRITIFLAAPMVGAIAGQIPIGLISDRVPRRTVILVVSLFATLFGLAPLTLSPRSDLVIVAMFFVGATVFPLYSLGIAYTNDWLLPEQIVGASAAQVRVNGTGAVFGPVVAAILMSIVDPQIFYWVIAASTAVIAVWVGSRMFVEDAPPLDRQRDYVPFPARASSVAANLIPRRRRDKGWPEQPVSPDTDA
ncbi:MAG: MFS transporter [Acidimicrobiales bacterium]